MFISSGEEVTKINNARKAHTEAQEKLDNEISRIHDSWKPFASLVQLYIDEEVEDRVDFDFSSLKLPEEIKEECLFREAVYDSHSLGVCVLKSLWRTYSIWKKETTKKLFGSKTEYKFVCFYKYERGSDGKVVRDLFFHEKYISLVESLFVEMKSDVVSRIENKVDSVNTTTETKKLIYPSFKESV